MSDLRTAAKQALEFIRWSQFVPRQSEPFPEPPFTAPQVEAALHTALVEDAMQKFTDVNQEIEAALAEPWPVGVVTSMVKGGVTWHIWPDQMPDGTTLYAAAPIIKPEIKDDKPVPPPEAQTEAEKIAYCAGWWAALEAERKELLRIAEEQQ